MRLVFLGPPGAGKGTVASWMSERLKVVHVASGDLLREAAKGSTLMGEQIRQAMQEGILVPDATVSDLVLKKLEELPAESGFILDGFPRTVEQAKTLDQALAKRNAPAMDLAIDFEVSDSVVVSRLNGRRVCSQCGANYHVVTLPPRRQGVCDRCGGPLKSRPDDEPEVVIKRLQVYRSQTSPLLVFYRAQGRLRSVSGEGEVEEQYRTVVDLLKRERLVG